RPTAVAHGRQAIIDAADPAALERHGRLLDGAWAPLWAPRVAATRARLADALAVRALADKPLEDGLALDHVTPGTVHRDRYALTA
ncbi:MAG TPA: hypothetical protein VGD80_24755, partial [Kofleriaceae bacterium]